MKTLFIEPFDPPAKRKIQEAIFAMQKAALLTFPTESNYWIGGLLSNANPILKTLDKAKDFDSKLPVVFCRDLAHVSEFANLSKLEFQLAKQHWPGPYCMLLAPRETIPRKVSPKRNKLFFTVPVHPVAIALLRQSDAPLFAFRSSNKEQNSSELRDYLMERRVVPDLSLDCGELLEVPLNMVECSDGAITILSSDEE